MQKSLKVPLILAIGLLAVLAAAAAFSNAQVTYRSAERNGERAAEVLIGDRPVIVIRTASGGYEPVERAEIIANRLRSALDAPVGPDDVTVGSVPGGAALRIRDRLIVAIYPAEADAHGATPTALARLWRENVLLALGEEHPIEPPPAAEEQAEIEEPAEEAPATPEQEVEPVQPPAEGEADWSGTAQKWVPVFSLEQEGVRLGLAQIAGPPSQVEKVSGVAQLRLDFRNIGRVYAYIPSSSISLRPQRVQGVSVWALADIQVLGF